MTNKLVRTLKGVYYPGIFLEVPRKTTKHLNLNNQLVDRDLKRGLPDYKAQESTRFFNVGKYVVKVGQQIVWMGDFAMCIGTNMERGRSSMNRCCLL